jgi:type IV pilus assembly protein PilE
MKLSSRRQSGFTLVELMVTVLIVSILVGIAIPSYSRYVMRTNRAAARACMMDYAQFMERQYTTALTYVLAANPVMGCSTDSGMGDNYVFTVARTQRTYTITATPIAAQWTRDTQCRALGLNQAGQRTEGGTGTVADCW